MVTRAADPAVTPPVRSPGLTARVFLGTALIVGAVIGAAFVITSASVRSAGEESARRGLEQSADLVAQFLAGRSRSLAGGARVFVQGPYFRTLVAERRGDDILDQAMEATEQLGADWVFITDDKGTLLAKSDEPGARGAALGTVPLVSGALRGQVTSGFGVSRDSLLFQAVAVPIVTPGGAPLGVLVATRLVDSLLVRDVKATTSSELLFYVHEPTGRRRAGLSTLGRGIDAGPVLAAVPESGDADAAAQPDVTLGGVEYIAQGSALTTAGGDVVGGFIVMRSRAAALSGIANLRRSLALAGVLGLLLSWVAAFVAARRIGQPVRDLASAVRQATEGEYAVANAAIAGVDGAGAELEELQDAFNALLAELRDKARLVALAPMAAPDQSAPDTDVSSRVSTKLTVGAPSPRLRFAARPGLSLDAGAMLANRYRIETVLGSGGLGIVYRAHDRVIGESVAVKVLRPEVLASDPDSAKRFAEELRVARRVSHRNIVRVHDIGEADGISFLTMELVDGASLASVLSTRGALPQAAVLSIGRQLVRALAVMHAEGVVHGDLKPSNLLLGPGGVLKVSDFGIAQVRRRAGARASDARGAPASDARGGTGDDAVAHLAGAVIGTPEYMAPEQLIGGPATPASDLYAAGVVLHACLHGSTPFDAETRVTFIAHKMDTPVYGTAVVRGPGPVAGRESLSGVIAWMMAPEVEARPRVAEDVLAVLRRMG